MPAIGIFFGTDTGRTCKIAKDIAKRLGESAATPVNIAKASPADLLVYDALILDTPTLGEGELPGLDTGCQTASWAEFLPQLAGQDFSGKRIALYGLGDQDKYGEFFVSALRPLYEAFAAQGARLIGHWPAADYQFIDSAALEGEDFLGLALDQINQAALTESRLDAWLARITPLLLAGSTP